LTLLISVEGTQELAEADLDHAAGLPQLEHPVLGGRGGEVH